MCTKCFDSKGTKIDFLEPIKHLSMFQPAEIAALETEIAPQIS